MIRKLKHITITLFLIVILSACNNIKTHEVSKDNSIIEESIKFLTSDECGGRLPNTEGNKLAKEYIVKKFKEMGLKPYQDNYYHSYKQKIPVINKDNVELELLLSKDKIKIFNYGKDFREGDIINTYLELPIYMDSNSTKDHIRLIKNFEDIEKFEKKINIKAFLLLDEISDRSAPRLSKGKRRPIFKVSKDTYNILKDNIGQTIKLSFNYNEEEIMEENIVGIIPSKARINAIVVTAHLDHVGRINDTIWRGAMDNGSGVSVLLDVAERLSSKLKDNNFNTDIIFSTTNSEEMGLIGSKKLNNLLVNNYQRLININIDCVGEKDNEGILIDARSDDKENLEIAKGLEKIFNENSISSKITIGQYPSDHRSFNIGVNISNDISESPIHTPDDTLDKLDLKQMSVIGEKTSQYIMNYLREDKTNMGARKIKIAKINNTLQKEEEKLEFGQFKLVNIDGRNRLIENTEFLGSIDEANKLYDNKLNFIPKTVGNMKLDNTDIVDRFLAKEKPNVEDYSIDKIYNKEMSIYNINHLNLGYENEDNSLNFGLQFTKYNKKDEGDMNLYKMNCGEKEFISDGTLDYGYSIKYTGKNKSITFKYETNENIYTIYIWAGSISKCKDKKEMLNFIKNNKIDNAIDIIFDGLIENKG
ncbi:M28 family metallopeptidase [Dethiothermospora halolimnae]|uniref:M28 family metallopeptidase n=1 Tax=Dethiothermospora halolimnae TaxID=3114390 RepID=UPI003CCC27C5